jgi:hypothetical protein
MESKKNRSTILLLALLVLIILLLIPFAWRSFRAVKASLRHEFPSIVSSPENELISGSIMHGGWIPSNTPTNRPPVATTILPPTATATLPPTTTATLPPTAIATLPPTVTPSLPPTVGPGGSPARYSTLGFLCGLIALGSFFLYFSRLIITRHKPD